ncbi:hypothetical protein JCM10914A_14570 [Paenibacillus sp. JCM 10914]
MKNKKVLTYLAILILPLFIIVMVLVDMTKPGRGGDELRLCIEWVTKYILPWIFLYWFVKLVRKIK